MKQQIKSQHVKFLPVQYSYYASPIGLLEVSATAEAVATLYFVDEQQHEVETTALLNAAIRQIDEYFAGRRQAFDLPLAFRGTDFQRRVWQQLLTVPYGQTSSYQAIANALGNSKAVRAVGAANGQNPISVIAPCHRIIGSNGSLVGYGGGLWRKEWLLKHEGYILA